MVLTAMVAWLSLLPVAPAAEKTTTLWMAAFVHGMKIGYEEITRIPAKGKVTTRETMHMEMSREGVPWKVDTVTESEETEDGKPLAFRTRSSDSGGSSMEMEGAVTPDGKLKIKIAAAGQRKDMVMDWPEGALLPEAARRLSLSKGLKENTTYTYKGFVPEFLRALDCETRVGKTVNVDLLGRVVPLTEMEQTLRASNTVIKVKAWVDENMDGQKIATGMLGMDLELIACAKAYALSPNTASNIFDRVFVAAPMALTPADLARPLRYELTFKSDTAEISIPDTSEQKRLPPSGGKKNVAVVEVGKLAWPQGAMRPYTGRDPEALAALKPSRSIESDAAEIVELMKKAVGDETDASAAAQRIETFVRRHIRKKNLSVGYATALEVARSREGDCTEHAVLTAALCRAGGIPARVVVGMAYAETFGNKTRVFVPHAWTQAFINGQWISLDAALQGFDSGHIALGVGHGDPDDFLNVAMTLGNFTITAVNGGNP
jgi:hypothetical protein